MHITKESVDRERPDGSDRVLWDDKLPGFGLRITPAGVKSYLIQYRASGRSRRLTLGRHGKITAEHARKLAKAKLGEVATGTDPAAERRRAIQEARAVLTVEQLGRCFLDGWKVGEGDAARHVPGKLAEVAASTGRNYRHAWETYIIPALGGRRLDELDPSAVLLLHSEVKARGAVQANRVVAALSSAWTWGRAQGLVPSRLLVNPARLERGQKTRERRDRGCALSDEELGQLGGALAEQSGPLADAFRVYLLSGCRPDEVLGLTWDQIHPDGRRVNLKGAKTGARVVYLGKVPASIIAAQPRERSRKLPDGTEERVRNTYVFTSLHPRAWGGRFASFAYLWGDEREERRPARVTPRRRDGAGKPRRPPALGLRTRAGLPATVRLYDAGRHTFTSCGYDLGYAEHIVRKLTGHAEADFDAHGRYRHLKPERLLAAADAIADSLWRDLSQSTPNAGRVAGGTVE